jgi:hypothetical protein
MSLKGLVENPFLYIRFGVSLIFLIGFLVFPCLIFAGEDCPQSRKTSSAPVKFLNMNNPIPPSSKNITAGKILYQGKATPIACKTCHGKNGNGNGELDFQSHPSARNFTCKKTMELLPDGQLFWVIKTGSKNTAMFAFSDLSDKQVWQLMH